MSAIVSDFAEHGLDTIARLRAKDPEAYLRIVSSLVPKELILEREQRPDVDPADLSVQEFADMIAAEHRRRFIQHALSCIDSKRPPPSLLEREAPDPAD